MNDLVVIAIIVAILSAAVLYIRSEKKKGVKCIGCPSAGTCSSQSADGKVSIHDIK